MPPLPIKNRRAATLCSLLELMPRLVTPEVAPIPAPDPRLLADPAHLAKAAAASATKIVEAIAALDEGDNTQHVKTLWTETLAQISRIQELYHLPPLPFQHAAPAASQPAALNDPVPLRTFPTDAALATSAT